MTTDTEITQTLKQLHSQCQTLHLATVGPNGQPDASYAPYVQLDDKYYIFVSQLAAHTQNLLAQRQASIMLIQPEQEAKSLFARMRYTCACEVVNIARTASLFNEVIDSMQERFGSIIELLTSLGDFYLLQLQPTNAHLVIGFGKAIELDEGRTLESKILLTSCNN